MVTARERRRLEPLPEQLQAALRRMIRNGSNVEDVARNLGLPTTTLLSGAAGARMLPTTRRRVIAALDRQRRAPSIAHLRLVPNQQAPTSRVREAAAEVIRSRGLHAAARELGLNPAELLSVSIGDVVPEHATTALEARLLEGESS